jgi:hypothetical protein
MHNGLKLFRKQSVPCGLSWTYCEVHKEIKRALRKKTQAKEDSHAQAEEEEEKESS